MATERRRFEGLLVCYQIAWIVRAMPFVNLKIDPEAINPWREHKEPSAEEIALAQWKAQRRWQLMCGGKK